MCGLVGFLDRAGLVGDAPSVLTAMASTIRHRGPDDEGHWWQAEARLGLGFRRLAIQDLSPLGHQPMTSASGRFTIAFNGEVYNFTALREELTGHGFAFRGGSDTEVMLAAFECWGVRAAVERFVGMFAFAVWDAQERELILVRDRLGVKPLYYGVATRGNRSALTDSGVSLSSDDALVFASELKPFRRFPGMRFDVDRGAMALYVRHAYVPGPWSIHRDIRKLPPGHLLRYRVGSGEGTLERYWSAKAVAEAGLANPFRGDDREAIGLLDASLKESVRQRMIADVPLGAFLSGGIDSAAIVAAMTAVATRPVRTFTIGVDDPKYNEADHAKAIAAHLGTEHVEQYVTADDALALIPKLPEIYDEPFADSSQIPTYLVSAAARRHVTVILSGDGGDELFGGYYRYRWATKVWNRLRGLPGPARRVMAGLLRRVPAGAANRTLSPLMWTLPATLRMNTPGDRAHKLANLMRSRDQWDLYWKLTSIVQEPASLLADGAEPRSPLTDPAWLADGEDFEARMMQADVVSYLVDDIMTKVDRASMAVSLEAREPYLDHRLVELAFRLPTHLKVRDGETKWILRQVLHQRVPRRLFERPKMGFSIPIERWLAGPLRDWAEHLLSPAALARDGLWRPDAVRALWHEHLSGQRMVHHQLWVILMFQAWAERWQGEPTAS